MVTNKSQISFQKMLRSLGLGLGLETFAKFLRVSVSVLKNLVREKSLGFGKFGLGRKVSVSEKFGLGKKSWFRFRKIWYRKKKSRYRFWSKFWYRHSVFSTSCFVQKGGKGGQRHFEEC